MPNPSPGYAITLRVETPSSGGATGGLVAEAARRTATPTAVASHH